jgi:hypothetical protein
MATKSQMDVPDISNLLGQISKKRDSGELPKTEIQHVQPVKTEKPMNSDELMSKKVKTQNQSLDGEPKGPGGRPKKLMPNVEYFKMSPRIPVALKEELDVALARRKFRDADGLPITTVDAIVELALTRLLIK